MQYKYVNLGPATNNWDWQVKAACRGMDVDLFYLPDLARGTAKRAHVAHAKEICATCPVITQCLDRALAVGEPDGVWGGLTADERDALHRCGGLGAPQHVGLLSAHPA